VGDVAPTPKWVTTKPVLCIAIEPEYPGTHGTARITIGFVADNASLNVYVR
jgi:hypothetical protein